MRLENKVAIVTGGGGSIGEGICQCLAREGANVVVSDVKLENAKKVAEQIKKICSNSLPVETDVRNEEQCQKLVDLTLKEMGHVDILVCCAGVNGLELRKDADAAVTLENVSEADWDFTMDINLKGVFFCNKAITPYFKEKKRGKIINISSIAGRKGSSLMPHYSASKAGVIVFTQAVAMELAPFHVNVNSVCPGLIWTPLWEQLAGLLTSTYPEFKSMGSKEIFMAMVERMVPFKAPQTAEDIGYTVVFLASDEANQITGQSINVDGGAVFN